MTHDREPATSVRTSAEAARAGAVDVTPILIGVIPFGLLAGVTATDIGLGVLEASGFSVIVFAGAAQLAAIDLLGRDAAVPIVIATALIINLRMLMYGASLAPYLAHEPRWRRAGVAYVLTDQSYALAVVRYDAGEPLRTRIAYYLGVAVPMWLSWQAATLVGAAAGNTIPESVPLSFAIPLMFLALLQPAVKDPATTWAAVVAGTVAVVAAPLPANLGLPLAAVSGIVAGTTISSRRRGTA
ncbi:MAG: AzlC family ABC transporter permease [Actinobacteria bacterium]|nr:AzlC family ABC transporter permease [Actinomycetota bacterium]